MSEIETIARNEAGQGFYVKFHWQGKQWECVLANNGVMFPNYQPRGYGKTQAEAYGEADSDRSTRLAPGGKYKLTNAGKPNQSNPASDSTLKAGLPR